MNAPIKRVPRLIFKRSCRIEGLYPEIMIAITSTYTVWCSMGLTGDCRVTSVTDDAPGRLPDSKHKIGQAFDLGIWGVGEMVEQLARNLRQALGVEFDVVVEGDHIHIEFDPAEDESEIKKEKQKNVG